VTTLPDRLALEEALRVVDAALNECCASGVLASVAVVNEFGQIVQLDRLDGAAPMTVELAQAKAQTALNFRTSTHALRALHNDAELAQIAATVRFPLLTLPGGTPLLRGGQVVGAVGVHSGGSGDQQLADRAAVALSR
jgi:uncharacterized protein GlcG (DUF336 family)